mgnify:CR=1 FL=1
MARKKTVLVVVAHADDMEFMAAGTVARFTQEKGYDVYEYILTDNSKGSYRLSEQELIEVSAREAVEAGEVLGLKEVRLEGYRDSRLDEEPQEVLRDKIMGMMREVEADIVMSWDPFAPGEDHPDHRVVAMATLESAAFCGNPMFFPEHEHPPHVVTEAYWFAKEPRNAGMFVDIGSTIDKKIEALLKHRCQMELTIDALCAEAQALGAGLLALEEAREKDFNPFIEMAIRDYCAARGEPKGMGCAEQFRYQKLGMLDTILGLNLITPDF